MKFSIVLGDTGFLGSAFSRSLVKEDADIIDMQPEIIPEQEDIDEIDDFPAGEIEDDYDD